MILGRREIEELIPLSEPALLLDRATLLAGNELQAEAEVSTADWRALCPGAKDVRAPLPFALLVESFTQACALLASSIAATPGFIPIISRMANVRLLAPVFVGDVMRHEVRLLRRSGGTFLLEGESRVAERAVLRAARLTAAWVPRSQFDNPVDPASRASSA